MSQKWEHNMLVRSGITGENEVIVIEDSDSDMDFEVDPAEVEIVGECNNQPVDLRLNCGFPTEFLTITSDYQNVLEEINNLLESKTSLHETELHIEDVVTIPALNLSLQNPQQTLDHDPTTKQDYKHDHDKLLEENKSLMTSLKNILECPVCLTMVRSSPVPSCYNGHIVCSSCWNMTHLCPMCRVKMHETEKCFSQTANSLLQLVTLPCQYEEEGCSYKGKKVEVEQHQQNCLFKDVCPKEPLGKCPTPGCRIGQEKNIEKNKSAIDRMTAPRAPTISAPRLHCDNCNRDFSRRYFNRHVCSQSAVPHA
eukprot:GFUD01037183.1.p1 GENE.GFUD01037183.1~~GFUD01037183.1.p1  ORF type:complete len:310 (-),score=68.71 GFUD01037183.1:243-1172(-)